MTDWNPKANGIFARSIEIESTSEREAFILHECSQDSELLARVREMLRIHQEADSFLREPLPGVVNARQQLDAEYLESDWQGKLDPAQIEANRAAVQEKAGTFIGPYELQKKLGSGGMGDVWQARQTTPVVRTVAIKLIKLGMDTQRVVARFKAEMQALALMDHPNIAQVLDAGSTESGRPYFAMELVDGESLTDYCDSRKLTINERIELLVSICDAIQHAHQKGVIHRDIKPSNVLVTGPSHKPLGKVIDFGLAKAINHRVPEGTPHSIAGQIVGTPHCMSPEQASPSTSQDIDTRTDVYSLGALLYELLVGAPPFDFSSEASVAFERILDAVRNEEPRKLSSRLASFGDSGESIATKRSTNVKSLRHVLSGDLEIIVHKSLEKERGRRYQSPNELADELRRFQGNQAIEARPHSLFYRLRKTAVRNRVAFVFGTLLLSTILAGIVTSASLTVRALRAEADLSKQLSIAKRLTREAEERAKDERWERYRTTMRDVSNSISHGANPQLLLDKLNDAPPEYRGWEWRHFFSRLQESALKVLYFGNDDLSYCPVFAIHPDRWELAIHQPDGSAAFWDPNERLDLQLTNQVSQLASAVKYSGNGELVAVAGDDNTVRVWNTKTGALHQSLAGHNSMVLSLAFSANGSQLATGGFDHKIYVWDLNSGAKMLARELQTQCIALAFHGDDSRLLISSGASVTSINLFDGPDRDFLGAETEVAAIAISPSGKLLVGGTSHPENRILVWDFETGEKLQTLEGHTNQISRIAFHPSNRQIASASLDQTVRVWDLDRGRAQHILQGHSAPVYDVAFSPSGERILTGSKDETARLWKSASGETLEVLYGHKSQVAQVAFSHDGQRCVTASFDGSMRIWDADSDEVGLIQGHHSFVYDIAHNPVTAEFASVAWDRQLVCWDADGRKRHAVSHPAEVVTSVSFDATGERIVTLSRLSNLHRNGRNVMVWEQNTGNLLNTIPIAGPNRYESRAATGTWPGKTVPTWIAVGNDAGEIHLLDLETGRQESLLTGHTKGIFDVCFRPHTTNGTKPTQSQTTYHLASASDDKTIRIWNLHGERTSRSLIGHKSGVIRVLYSPHGKILASSSNDKTVRLWDGATYDFLAELTPGSIVYGLAFSPDESRLALGCADNTIRLIDMTKKQEVAFLQGHKEYVHAVSFSPDGTRLVSASGDTTIRVWDSGKPATHVR